MNATSLYVSTCRLVLQANPEDPGCWADLYRLIPYLRQSLSCTVCGNLLIEPYTPTETNCQHHVCRSCKGGKKKLKPSCSWCKNYEKYVENVQLRILLQCYKKLCEYIINSSIYRLMCKTTASGDTNIANMTDLIQEGAGFKDEFKSNSGLSKSAYSILPCIYASASTQTITQAINLNNDSDIAIDEDVSVAKSNLSNGSSIYSVTYAGSGNKMVIKRKAMLNKGEMENCENLRLIKGSNFKRPIHRRGNFRGRGRAFKEEDKTNSTGVSNCTVSSNNVNSGRVNIKKKKLGCRCGNATASPGKLTCCGQRCPCYVDSKACLDCKCRGCRNPHTKEGQKVIRDPIDSANNKLQSPAQLQTDEGIPNNYSRDSMDCMSNVSNSKRYRNSATTGSMTSKQLKGITITVESIENVDEKIKEIVVVVNYTGDIISQSSQTPIINSRADIDLTAMINTQDTTPEFLNEILSNPVLFTVLDCTVSGNASVIQSISPPNAEVRKKVSKSSVSPMSTTKSVVQNNNVLGICNLDIGSLVMEENRIKQTLLVESEKKLTPLETVVWNKLPKLVVVATAGDEPLLSKSNSKSYNMMGVTVESIYNVPDHITEGSVFDACMQVPMIGDKTCRIKFPNGVTSMTKEFNCRKKWVNLSHIEGPGAKSKYRISPAGCDIISDLPEKEDLGNDLMKLQKSIRWDMWRNCLMLKTDVNYFCQKLMKYRVWPIEITLPSRSKEQIQKEKSAKSDKKSKPAPSAPLTNGDHYTAFLNLSPLLHPGETRVRVAAQLMTYSQADLVNKFGAEISNIQSQVSTTVTKSKTASEKSKASARDSEEYKDTTPGMPVFDAEGSPTFIVVEIEFLKPLCQKRNPERIEEDLRAYLSIKGDVSKKTTTLEMMEGGFSQSILDAVSTVTMEYQKYCLSNSEVKEGQIEDDTQFYEVFCKGKNFNRIKATLENKIVHLINEKYGALEQYESKIPAIYAYLVNEMHKITNRYAIGQSISYPHLYKSDLQLYAEEAIEEEEYQLAKEYLLLKLSTNTMKPDYWLDLAVFFIKTNAHEEAVQAVREALCLDFHHRMGLLMYALLMIHKKVDISEMTFEILLSTYPNYVEGWKVLRYFYITCGNNEGAIFAQKQARRLEYERIFSKRLNNNRDPSEVRQADFCLDTYDTYKYEPATEEKYGITAFSDGFSWVDNLSWTTTICPPNDIKIRTAVLLQKLGFYEFAEICLSETLLSSNPHTKPPPPVVYYTSVNHYLQGRYEDCIPILQTYVKEYGKDCFIWSLLGHCFFKLENHAKAIACYEYVLQSFNRPDDIHLIYSRMGFYYIQAKKYDCAKQILKTACKYSPTPRLWKGVGIACLMTEDFEEAEIAFTEANYFDNRDPETWAYLAITNILMRRLDLFKQCYTEAKKRGLSNQKLLHQINCLGKANGLTSEEFDF